MDNKPETTIGYEKSWTPYHRRREVSIPLEINKVVIPPRFMVEVLAVLPLLHIWDGRRRVPRS